MFYDINCTVNFFWNNAAIDPHNAAHQAPNDGQSSIKMLKYISSLSLLTSHHIDYLPQVDLHSYPRARYEVPKDFNNNVGTLYLADGNQF